MGIAWSSIAVGSAFGAIVLSLGRSFSVSAYLSSFFLLYFADVLLSAVYNVVLYPYLFSPLRHLPSPKGNSFLFGQFKAIFNNPTGEPQQWWINDVPNDGLIYYRSLFNIERLMPTTPQILSEVMTQRSYDFIKPPELRNGLGRILGVGILLAEGEEHRIQRKNLMPAFQYRHVRNLYPKFWSISASLVQKLRAETANEKDDAPIVEISSWGSRATLDIIGSAGLGLEFGSLDNPNNELSLIYGKVLQPSQSSRILAFVGLVLPQSLLRMVPTKFNGQLVAASQAIRKIAANMIREKRQKMLDRPESGDLDILSQAIGSGGFSDENLVDQLMTMLLAGHETTSTALTWTIYLLCKHPDLQTRLRDEVRSKLPSPESQQPMTDQLLDQCTYLHAVCSEVLRLYAPVPITLRVAAHDTTLHGVHVRKGTALMLSIWAINTWKELWGDDAAEFNPDRWMGSGKAGNGGASSNYAFMTFIHGPRSCIGQSFARAEFACLVAALVGSFSFQLADENMEVKIKGGITARPAGGLKVKMRQLHDW